ncbi:tetratricopeptide repeat protein [Staphylococcus petrasii]|uniref:Tetratricopeptide repeat protein n=1 Tax=Staphylococcus petrasii TaxID=1276936 RepID=A0ABY2KXN8_9STAP|nr:tetratricopeptide repeat protein [Staphylococcus petrasii]TGE18839.1 tetratricopeptide repeat protein [Staphylococcus petrasii]
MAQKNNNVISMVFDEDFYRKMADQKFKQQDYKKAAEYYKKVLDLSPDDFDIQLNYTHCLTKMNLGSQAEKLFYENIIKRDHVEESYYQLSELNIELNEPNKAFLFGINYVILTKDKDYRAELEKTFEVSYISEEKIELEAQLFATQLLFQYLFSQGRLEEARAYILQQDEGIQEHRVVRNLLAMCYLYLSEYETAKELFETLLSEDNSDVHALCHYTLLLYNTNETEKYQKYLKILSKVVPMNDDESFKLGIVLSYLKQYEASQQLLLPLYKKGKFASIQMFNALSFNYYYLGNKEQSELFWDKLLQISKVDVGYAPWVIEESKQIFDQKIEPLLMDDDSHYRLYGVFLLNQLNGKEILMTEEIWSVLETMNDYEKLYLTYLVQGLHLNKLDFIHRGLLKLYNNKELRQDTELFISWIDKGEGLIANEVDLSDVDRYVAAHVYLYHRYYDTHMTKKEIIELFNTSKYKLDSAINQLLSI